VHLEKAATGAVIPQLVIGKPKDDVELQTPQQNSVEKEECETYEFRWQEKVFCQVRRGIHQVLFADADVHSCRVWLSTAGDRAFPAVAACVRNELPQHRSRLHYPHKFSAVIRKPSFSTASFWLFLYCL